MAARKLLTNDETIAAREDGAASSGQWSRIRHRRVHSPARMGILENLDGFVAADLFWEFCENIQLTDASTGRPRTTTVAGIMLLDLTANLTGSIRSAGKLLGDPMTWQRLMNVAEQAWPHDASRRLPDRPATRDHHYRFRERHITATAAQTESLRVLTRSLSVGAAVTVDFFNARAGSFSSPGREQTIAGDATFVKSMFNTNQVELVDPETGETWTRRVDTDATWTKGTPHHPSYQLVDAIAQGNEPGERIILDAALRPNGIGDGEIFCGLVDAIQRDLGLYGREAFAATYDMALAAADHDHLLDSGVLPISKVSRNKKGEIAELNLGSHRFKLRAGSWEELTVFVVDGTPHIQVATTEGPMPVALERIQTKRRDRKNGTYQVTTRWQVPDCPEAPPRLVKAEVRINNQSTQEELNRSRPMRRTRTLRPIPPSDPAFAELFGTRESTESMHQHWKASLPNKRARTVGSNRLRHSFHSYQMSVNITTLMRFAARTGDWSAFGDWRPPQHVAQTAA